MIFLARPDPLDRILPISKILSVEHIVLRLPHRRNAKKIEWLWCCLKLLLIFLRKYQFQIFHFFLNRQPSTFENYSFGKYLVLFFVLESKKTGIAKNFHWCRKIWIFKPFISTNPPAYFLFQRYYSNFSHGDEILDWKILEIFLRQKAYGVKISKSIFNMDIKCSNSHFFLTTLSICYLKV